MANKIPEVDAYIEKAAEFARPILKKIRTLFHKASPKIQEVMKWGVPHFKYKGIVGSMAAFKQHAGFGLWKASLLKDPNNYFCAAGETAMGGRKVTDVSQLPADKTLIGYIREAVALNEAGVKAPPTRRPKKPLRVPEYFLEALAKNKKALATFEAFSPSHKREYVEWVTEAKQEATRAKRLATSVEWLAEGKPHNWRYMNC